MSNMRTRVFLGLFVALSSLISISHLLAQDSDKSGEVIYDVHKTGENGITPPKGLYTPDPEYTDDARRKKISGSVVLSVVVETDGNVRDASVKQSLDKGLDKEALKTVKMWTFQPATKDGQPVPVRIDVEMTFRIR